MNKAIMYLEAAVRLEPGNALYRNNLAYAQSVLGSAAATAEQLDTAVEYYRSIVSSQPDNAMYRNMLGIAYGKRGCMQKRSNNLVKRLGWRRRCPPIAITSRGRSV